MFCRFWQWLIVAMSSTLGIACSHSRCNQCAPTVGTHAVAHSSAKSSHACNSCSNAAAIPIITVRPIPGATSKTYAMIPNTPCNTCARTPVAVGPVQTASPKSAPTSSPLPRVLSTQPDQPNPDESPNPYSIAKAAEAANPHTVAKTTETAKPPRTLAGKMVQTGHAADYSWIVGEMHYLHGRRQWRVRYTSHEVDDSFGGVVTIIGLDHMADQFKEGSTVRLRGQLVDPNGRKSAPEYYVHDIFTVD